MEDEEERRHLNVWTDMEKCIFLDRFLHHPKDFRKIASFLRNKTTKDCIQFYYDSKKSIPFKHALKEFINRKKQRGNVVSWDATIQSALSVGAIVKVGNNPEKPLKFLLPSNDYTFHTKAFHPMRLEIFNSLDLNSISTKNPEEIKAKDKQKKISNWFILDASNRKFLKHSKEETLKRKSLPPQDNVDIEEEAAPKKVQRTSAAESVHPDLLADTPRDKEDENIIDEKKHPNKPQKWTTEEKNLFFDALDKYGEFLKHRRITCCVQKQTHFINIFTSHNRPELGASFRSCGDKISLSNQELFLRQQKAGC